MADVDEGGPGDRTLVLPADGTLPEHDAAGATATGSLPAAGVEDAGSPRAVTAPLPAIYTLPVLTSGGSGTAAGATSGVRRTRR